MNTRNDVKRPSDQSFDARHVLAAARLQFAARVDILVARWLERCTTNVEAAQWLFKTDRKPTREVGMTCEFDADLGKDSRCYVSKRAVAPCPP